MQINMSCSVILVESQNMLWILWNAHLLENQDLPCKNCKNKQLKFMISYLFMFRANTEAR